jgi:uncharacterized protein (DUF697 family)
MGHTVSSQRMVADDIVAELKSYGKALRSGDRAFYEDVLKQAFKHYGSISYASSIHTWAFLLLSILLEQEKRIQEMEHARMAHGRLQGT